MIIFSYVSSVQQDHALGRIIQTAQQFDKSGLSASVRTHNSKPLSCAERHRYIAQRVLLLIRIAMIRISIIRISIRNIAKFEFVLLRRYTQISLCHFVRYI